MRICVVGSGARLLVLLAGLLMAAASSWAQNLPPPGRLLASNCFQCHGTHGAGPGFDNIAGKSADKLFKEIKEYQRGEEGEGLMAKHARGYSDAQLRQITQWLSQQKR
jgi:cytochrome subunit of sulfide dehydrogenase